MSTAPKFVIGNWKMQAQHERGLTLAGDVTKALEDTPPPSHIRTVICPPYTQLSGVNHILRKHDLPTERISLGAQDCYPAPSGPFTGDISAKMLTELGARYVILGHSERRQNHGETDAVIRQKVKAATAAGLIPIVCIGEHLAERNEGRAASVLAGQIEGSLTRGFRGIVAYEPVWAIGSGITPSHEELQRKLSLIRALLPMRLMTDDIRVPVLYGGSVTSVQTPSLLSIDGLDGVLVGSASLEAQSFLDIIRAATEVPSSSPS
ncbi:MULTISPECIES: triose-phosphate isomerase [unclassified Saccharibacter]|uniref:triose-phosphate isomerase n=1 Tax=unclassified Saccharibacter TaxID=2648722 RepID=UPI001352E8E8|nr:MULTISPECIES: triose-phosphate isomerase [unclassified Saccharibacter]MXV57160.1 triose-phosphate isomerase [Saccharibacter sp. EH70]MXV66480.1 triose-phosphate isomerase [Saccharibacter sp. EH60]